MWSVSANAVPVPSVASVVLVPSAESVASAVPVLSVAKSLLQSSRQ